MLSRKFLYLAGLVAAVIFAFLIGGKFSLFDFGQKATTPSSTKTILAQAGSPEKFAYLEKQRSNSCSLKSATVEGYADDFRLQGSCCSPMNLHKYQEQVETLNKFVAAPFASLIPQDPYDIPASLAKELLGYKASIELTSAQQAIYDEAMKLSDEGGPCCCRCWRWDAFEGQAKFLITKYDFSAQEIADIWDTEDGCGGQHDHG